MLLGSINVPVFILQEMNTDDCYRETGHPAVPLSVVDDAAGFFSAEHLVDNGRCAADTGADGQRPLRAIALAGAALDAGVTMGDLDLSVQASKHTARANGKAGAAAVAQVRFVVERDDIFEIDHGLHSVPLPA